MQYQTQPNMIRRPPTNFMPQQQSPLPQEYRPVQSPMQLAPQLGAIPNYQFAPFQSMSPCQCHGSQYPQQIIPYQMGPPLLPEAIFRAAGYGVRGAPYGLPNNAVGGALLPSFTGYKRLDPYSSQKNSLSPQKDNYFKEEFTPGRPAKTLPMIDTSMQNEKIYCVLCQQSYLDSERQAHIKKHQRKPEPYQPIVPKRPQPFIKPPAPTPTPAPIPAPTPGPIDPQNDAPFILQPTKPINPQNDAPFILQSQPSSFSNSSQPQQPPDFRFSRNTFISDEPSPILQPRNDLYGRETLQSNQFRGSQNYFVGANDTVNSLPKRDTVVSQDFRTSSNQQMYRDSMLGANLQKAAVNHQSIMSPIRQQSQHRLTSSQNQFSQNLQSSYRNTATTPQTVPQQEQPYRSTVTPNPTNTSFGQQKPVYKANAGDFNFDDFGYSGGSSPDLNIIPRESRKTINNQIPFSQIINDKLNN